MSVKSFKPGQRGYGFAQTGKTFLCQFLHRHVAQKLIASVSDLERIALDDEADVREMIIDGASTRDVTEVAREQGTRSTPACRPEGRGAPSRSSARRSGRPGLEERRVVSQRGRREPRAPASTQVVAELDLHGRVRVEGEPAFPLLLCGAGSARARQLR